MPGILPMKVIRVGGNAQSRIAQACDRCRSKKIRCDGVRPCCTQCANVGFECKTSDKLSRRAFPRGYTESLEDRVRGLEAEVRELKDLLDEKDEKIDMLSKIHSFSPVPRKPSASASPPSAESKSTARAEPEEALEVAPPSTDSSMAPAGTSSTSSFIESFKAKVLTSGRSCSAIKSSTLRPVVRPSSPGGSSPKTVSRAPPRLLSDQYINVFFQEWAPLFPMINRASFLKIYQEFLVEPESPKWQNRKHDIAQLYLVFDIASLSIRSTTKQNISSYEQEWRRAMQAIPSAPSLATLQCHVFAQIIYLLKDDQKHFLRHRASGVTIAHQLGLHLNQDQLSLVPFDKETRKRVFWAQYIIDRFGSSTCGVPMLLRETDISTEYPTNVDDENITASGFQTPESTEPTKMSNFLALIKVSRILSKVLDSVHRPAAEYSIPISKFTSLTEELDQWVSGLPGHLRLKFANDKPSTGTISDRSPLLSLAEFYIRVLINRPLISFGSGNTASAALLTSASAAKHIVQVCDLLDERSMNYTFPLSKGNLLLTAGFTLLWQSLDLPSESKLIKDNQKTLTLIARMMYRESEAAATEFAKIMSSLVGTPSSPPVRTPSLNQNLRALHPTAPTSDMTRQKTSARDHLRAIAARFAGSSFGTRPKPGDMTQQERPSSYVPHPQLYQSQRNTSRVSVASAQTEPGFPILSPVTSHGSNHSGNAFNLDYFPLGNDSAATLPNLPQKGQSGSATWEQMLANIDSGDSNIYNSIYGGYPLPEVFPADGPLNLTEIDPSVLSASIPSVTSNNNTNYYDSNSWSPDSWPMSAASVNTLVNLHDIQRASVQQAPAQSVISYTSEEDSLPSSGGEDFSSLNGSSGMSNSVYSDHGSNSRKGTSVSSVTSGGHHYEVGSIDATVDGTNLDSSSYGGIVIPNEYGIGF